MRRFVPWALLLLMACSKRVTPCEPWVAWGLADMADAPGQRLERCDASRLRFRVIPGGRREHFLRELGRRPHAGWNTSKEGELSLAGQPVIFVSVNEDGGDLVVELRVTATE